MNIRNVFRVLAFFVVMAGSAVCAQNFPAKPIKIIVPVAAGGGTDLLARSLGQKVGDLLGQPVVVENILGAGGNIGVQAVAKAAPDGYTLLLSPATIATNVAVFRKLPYDLLKDLQTVTLVGQTSVVLVVHPSFSAKTVAEFVEAARQKPGALNYGSAGIGSPQHLQSELFSQRTGISGNHIPYKGQSQAMSDLVGGQLNYMFSPLQNALPFIKEGRIRALGVASPQRNPALPQMPSFAELGYKDVDFSNWFALYAPAGTPAAIVKKLSDAFVQVGRSAEMAERLAKLGFEPFLTTPEEGNEFMRSELARWSRVASQANIKAE
ncbi:MAG: tripartite tricarboxylate transporter substrate binding protein [Comamonadaceae bacterium]|jgi:tripartite-type tricarboxylate transporter receptor subunit TctC|nr:tripartite tricarboxylate transporter substrate binding protein [Comamonadaceae bacterium]